MISHYDTPTFEIFTIQNMNFPCKNINFYIFHIPSLSNFLIKKKKTKLISKPLFIKNIIETCY